MIPYIPERFRRRVITHAVGVMTVERHPLLLAIQGQPGDGKSFQLRYSLEAAGCTPFTLSASLLAGQYEGDAVAALQATYSNAGEFARMNPECFPALVIEDFDLSPAGQRNGVQYTVNSQLLSGFLMHLADDVTSCGVGTSERFPLFVTGNDLASLHGPLTRPGRMEIFSWEPSTEERADVVHSLLVPHLSPFTRQDAARLIKKYPGQPISAFAAALTDCLARRSYEIVALTGSLSRRTLQRELAKNDEVPIADYLAALTERANPQFSLRNFIQAGR
ncbi:MAG TPA: AAA family ATPase [Streptosporangiaceae bacterium]